MGYGDSKLKFSFGSSLDRGRLARRGFDPPTWAEVTQILIFVKELHDSLFAGSEDSFRRVML